MERNIGEVITADSNGHKVGKLQKANELARSIHREYCFLLYFRLDKILDKITKYMVMGERSTIYQDKPNLRN